MTTTSEFRCALEKIQIGELKPHLVEDEIRALSATHKVPSELRIYMSVLCADMHKIDVWHKGAVDLIQSKATSNSDTDNSWQIEMEQLRDKVKKKMRERVDLAFSDLEEIGTNHTGARSFILELAGHINSATFGIPYIGMPVGMMGVSGGMGEVLVNNVPPEIRSTVKFVMNPVGTVFNKIGSFFGL